MRFVELYAFYCAGQSVFVHRSDWLTDISDSCRLKMKNISKDRHDFSFTKNHENPSRHAIIYSKLSYDKFVGIPDLGIYFYTIRISFDAINVHDILCSFAARNHTKQIDIIFSAFVRRCSLGSCKSHCQNHRKFNIE